MVDSMREMINNVIDTPSIDARYGAVTRKLENAITTHPAALYRSGLSADLVIDHTLIHEREDNHDNACSPTVLVSVGKEIECSTGKAEAKNPKSDRVDNFSHVIYTNAVFIQKSTFNLTNVHLFVHLTCLCVDRFRFYGILTRLHIKPLGMTQPKCSRLGHFDPP